MKVGVKLTVEPVVKGLRIPVPPTPTDDDTNVIVLVLLSKVSVPKNEIWSAKARCAELRSTTPDRRADFRNFMGDPHSEWECVTSWIEARCMPKPTPPK